MESLFKTYRCLGHLRMLRDVGHAFDDEDSSDEEGHGSEECEREQRMEDRREEKGIAHMLVTLCLTQWSNRM